MARQFNNSTGDRIAVPHHASFNTGNAITIAIWYIETSNTSFSSLIDHTENGDASTGWWITARGSTQSNEWQFTFDDNDFLFNNLSERNVWLHLCFTYDGTTVSCYKNGVLDSTLSGGGRSINNATEQISMGISNNAYGEDTLEGSLAEPGVWDRVLSAGEIKGLGLGYSPLHYPDGLVMHCNLVRDVVNQIGTGVATEANTLVIAHPSIIYPFSSVLAPFTGSGGGAPSTFIPAWALQRSGIIGAGI